MAIRYVKSGATGAGNGTSWNDAFTTLTAAYVSGAPGDWFYVSHQHVENTAGAVTLTSPGTAANPCVVLCVNDTAQPPAALATTAVINCTGANVLSFAGFAYYYGITFNNGSGTSSTGAVISINPTTPFWLKFEACSLRLLSTGATCVINIGNASTAMDDAMVELVNTTLSFAAAGQSITHRCCRFRWTETNGAILGTAPTALFIPGGGGAGFAEIRGVDLSALGAGKALVNIAQAAQNLYLFENCRLGSSVSITTGSSPGQGGTEVNVVNCDSADTKYRVHAGSYQGAVTQETTIVRTGGANDGTTTFSRKMASSANVKFFVPLDSDAILRRNESVSPITLSIPVITDGVTLANTDAWLELEYQGVAGYPQAVRASNRAANILAAGSNHPADNASAWGTTGLTAPVKQLLSVTITPTGPGIISGWIRLARPSTTLYFDPKFIVS